MTTITYEEASKELEQIRQEWGIIEAEVEANYLSPREALKMPHKISALVERENEISRRIKETWPTDSPEKIQLRSQYQEVQEAYKKAQAHSVGVEKRLFGMQTKEQQEQTINLRSNILTPQDMLPTTVKKSRLVVETTDSATTKTHQIMKGLADGFKGNREAKRGEITVNFEE